MMALSCPFKEDYQVLSCFMPLPPPNARTGKKKKKRGNILPLSFGMQKCIHTPDFFFLCGWNNKLVIYSMLDITDMYRLWYIV